MIATCAMRYLPFKNVLEFYGSFFVIFFIMSANRLVQQSSRYHPTVRILVDH